jgi:endonuclease/exonuclease/phosphatase family metal-dependent hydrolase
MRILLIFSLFASLGSSKWLNSMPEHGAADPDSSVRVMTYNIRYNNPDDGVNAWPKRKKKVISMIRFHRADLIGMQEVLKEQLDTLASWLPAFAWIGVGRDDGRDGGEFAPIFYRQDRFEALDWGTYWLSETPAIIGSVGWDAALTRIVTWAKFKDLLTETVFFHFNTHFDHRGDLARAESAKLIRQRAQSAARSAPVLVTGDLNVPPTSSAYASMHEGNYLFDAIDRSLTPHHGPRISFFGFDVSNTRGRRIDYIFVSNNVHVLRHGILTDQWSGYYPSDHLPVLAEVHWQ